MPAPSSTIGGSGIARGNAHKNSNTLEVEVDESLVHRLAENDPKYAIISTEAKAATESEHSMTLREAISKYPKAILWSAFLSFAITQEGYDLVLVSAFNA
jgi:SP family general alpha glucoside:H+ symporter-like MFS transporter